MMTSCADDEFWNDADDEILAKMDIPMDKAEGSSLCDNHAAISSKFDLECDKILEKEGTPLERYRPKYLIVSDLASQHWCEQRLLYDFSFEVYVARVPAEVEVKVVEDVKAKVAKEKGSNIHLARELEIQVPVEVTVKTKEDKWAVKVVNLLTAVCSFHHGCRIAREVPVFGCPFDKNVFVMGIIDEIQYDPSNHSLKISELKTRCSSYPPKQSHQDKDKFQVGLYRQLFNELVLQKGNKEMLESHLDLDLTKPFSPDVIAHVRQMDVFEHCEESSFNLNRLLDHLFNQLGGLTCVDSGQVEYIHQETNMSVAVVELDWSEADVKEKFDQLSAWWTGARGTQGVEIEDCWKCQYCPYQSWCEWRHVMARKTSKCWR